MVLERSVLVMVAISLLLPSASVVIADEKGDSLKQGERGKVVKMYCGNATLIWPDKPPFFPVAEAKALDVERNISISNGRASVILICTWNVSLKTASAALPGIAIYDVYVLASENEKGQIRSSFWLLSNAQPWEKSVSVKIPFEARKGMTVRWTAGIWAFGFPTLTLCRSFDIAKGNVVLHFI